MCMKFEYNQTPWYDVGMTQAHNLSVRIADQCMRNEEGDLLCKKCGSPVRIDWFEYMLECQGCDELD